MKEMSIEECIEFLGYRIDEIHQVMVDLSVPAINGIMATSGGLRVNRQRLSKISLPEDQLKEVKRAWLVGIWDQRSARGITVFEHVSLLEALKKAVEYVKRQQNNAE